MPSNVFWDNVGIVNHALTFSGATAVANYASIPAGWK